MEITSKDIEDSIKFLNGLFPFKDVELFNHNSREAIFHSQIKGVSVPKQSIKELRKNGFHIHSLYVNKIGYPEIILQIKVWKRFRKLRSKNE